MDSLGGGKRHQAATGRTVTPFCRLNGGASDAGSVAQTATITGMLDFRSRRVNVRQPPAAPAARAGGETCLVSGNARLRTCQSATPNDIW